MIGLGSSIAKPGKIGKRIVRDGLVLKHDYNAGAVEPCSTGAADINADAAANEYIDVGVIPITTNDVTISAWVYITALVDEAAIFCNRTNSGDKPGVELRCDANGFEMFIDKGSGSGVSTVSAANTNQWYHVCGVWDRSDKSFLYVDGVLVDSDDISGHSDNLTHSQAASIGKNVSSKEFRGYVCNVGYWNAALTQPQIKSIMLKDYAGLSASEKTDLVSWWTLDSVIDSVEASTAVYDNHYAGGSELGAEMVSNGSFDENDTGWDIDSGGAGTIKTWVNSFGGREGVEHVDIQGTTSANNRLKQNIDYISGAWYKVQADIYVVSGVVRIDGKDADMLGGTGGDVITTSGTDSWVTYTAYGYTPNDEESNTDSLFIRALDGSTAEFYIDNVSVKQVNGNTGTLA
jgi:hypothetical protein